MANLIDRTELIALMEKGYCEPCKDEKLDRNGVCCRVCWVNDAISEIDRMPTIDAVPVRHGKWKLIGADKKGRGGIWKCAGRDGCGKTYPYQCDYCPHCGAKMEVQDDD